MSKKFVKKYSGKKSMKFWKLVQKVYADSYESWERVYSTGCLIQEIENSLENLINSYDKEIKKKG